jgi:hypothetical protein
MLLRRLRQEGDLDDAHDDKLSSSEDAVKFANVVFSYRADGVPGEPVTPSA